MKQTAVEWIIQWAKDNPVAFQSDYYAAIEQAKEMEKQQIIDAHLIGLITSLEMEATKQATEYFNETYGSGALSEKGGAVTSSQTEISDEEIEKAIIHQDVVKQEGYCHCFLEGAKWYREQLKSK